MLFAILQQSLAGISAEDLAQAFEGVPGLTKMDAGIIGADAFGVLLERQEQGKAQKIVEALAGLGVRTILLPQSELKELPPVTQVQSAVLKREALAFQDSGGRVHTVPWKDLRVLSWGKVERLETQVMRELRVLDRYFAFGRMVIYFPLYRQVRTGIKLIDHVVLEIATQTARYRCKNISFSVEGKGANLPADAQGIPEFIEAVRERATSLALTTAVEKALVLMDTVPVYPSLHAFEEEIRWRLLAEVRPELGLEPPTI